MPGLLKVDPRIHPGLGSEMKCNKDEVQLISVARAINVVVKLSLSFFSSINSGRSPLMRAVYFRSLPTWSRARV